MVRHHALVLGMKAKMPGIGWLRKTARRNPPLLSLKVEFFQQGLQRLHRLCHHVQNGLPFLCRLVAGLERQDVWVAQHLQPPHAVARGHHAPILRSRCTNLKD
eukprot:366175-Chlamydomonas_euryale.AAC.4